MGECRQYPFGPRGIWGHSAPLSSSCVGWKMPPSPTLPDSTRLRSKAFMEYRDYYQILGVTRAATADEIKKAYRRLARKFHPDVSKEANAEQKFKEVQEAYEVLKDPEKRAAYDQLGSDWKSGQQFRPPPGWTEGFEFRGSPGGGGF